MKTYQVRCEWDETGWWIVTVPEVPGAVTQTRRLDKVAEDVGEVLALLASREPGTYELSISTVLPDKLGAVAAEALELRAEMDRLTSTIATTTSTAVATLAGAGFSMRDIGELVGVSHQRVGQILGAPKRKPGSKVVRNARTGQSVKSAATGKHVSKSGKASNRVKVS